MFTQIELELIRDALPQGAARNLVVGKIDEMQAKAGQGEAMWKAYCKQYGFEPYHLGAIFVLQGTAYKITGIRPSAPRFPIIGERMSDGRGFKFPAATVRTLLPADRNVA